MKQLLLVRHAQADSDSQGRDFDRPLTAEGSQQALEQAERLRELAITTQVVLASPASRARETARIVCEHLGIDARRCQLIEGIYEASAGDLIRLLEPYLATDDIMLVGHNPGVGSLAGLLVGGQVSMRPASLARLEFEPPLQDTPQPGSARLVELHHAYRF